MTAAVEMTPDERDWVAAHVDFAAYGAGGRYSSLVAAMRDARGATSRNERGRYRNQRESESSASWLGAIGYLSVLDQLGTCFARTGEWQASKVAIIRAIGYWAPEVTSTEAHALYALRCSLVHAYSLWNDGGGEPRQRHKFGLVVTPGADLVTLPPKAKRGGNLRSRDEMGDTIISLRQLGDMVETVVLERIPQDLADGRLAWFPGMTFTRLNTEFSFRIAP
jgi:hypothetical protein